MSAALMNFLALAETRPFSFGHWDCCLWLADWGRTLTGIDGGAAWRGHYRTALGCARLLRREGGVRALVERGALAVGMKPLSEPVAGAVGVVDTLTDKGPAHAGAIFTGRRWVVLRRGSGVRTVDGPAIAMWGL